MNCPKCNNQELSPKQVEGSDVILYHCAGCKGVWFLRDQMESVVPDAIKELAVPSNAKLGQRPCPLCTRPMHVFYYPQTLVEIDMCKTCLGLWLDVGECREIMVLRKALKSNVKEYDDVPGTKGVVIDLVNKALDWVMHSY